MILIGFTGRAGAGKDTAADALVEHCGFIKFSFAATLKRMLNEAFGWDMEHWDDFDWKETPQPELFGKSPRYLAQTLGTEWGRNLVHPDIWVELALREARMFERVVFADVRFPNEAQAIRRSNGIIVEVVRTDHESTAEAGHESEAGIGSPADLVISAASAEISQIQKVAVMIAEKLGAN